MVCKYVNYALAPSGLDEKTEEDGIKAGKQAGRQEGDQEKIVGIRHGLGRTFLGGSKCEGRLHTN